MTDKIIQTLKLKLVAAELAKLGITDREQVIAIAARTTVSDNGAIVGLKADGNRGVGSAPDYELSIADVAKDMGVTKAADSSPPGQGETMGPNPFVKGPHFSVTAQMVMMKNAPEKAEHYQYLASIGRQ